MWLTEINLKIKIEGRWDRSQLWELEQTEVCTSGMKMMFSPKEPPEEVCSRFLEDSEPEEQEHLWLRELSSGCVVVVVILAEKVNCGANYQHSRSQHKFECWQVKWLCLQGANETINQTDFIVHHLFYLTHLQMNINGFTWNVDNNQDAVGN